MNSTISRERPAHAGDRSGSGASSVLPYIDHDEDEKPDGTAARNERSEHGEGSVPEESNPPAG